MIGADQLAWSRRSTSGDSAAHVREGQTPVVRAEVSEHLRLDLRGVRVIGDLPADEQFVVISELPDAPSASVTDWHASTELAELIEPLAQMTLTASAEIGLADVDDPFPGHPQRSQLSDGDCGALSLEVSRRRHIEKPRRLITRPHDNVDARLCRHVSIRQLREWNPAGEPAQVNRINHADVKPHSIARASLRS